MNIKASALILIGCGIATAALYQPLTAQTNRNRTLEERVSILETQVAALSLQIQNLDPSGRGTIKRTYTGIGETWQISNIGPQNATVILANGSRWSISPSDRSLLYKWERKQVVAIEESRNRDFPYRLRNTERKEQCEAQYAGTG